MSIYDDRDTAITRDPLQGQGQQHYQQPMQPQYQQPYAGYGYGSPYGRGGYGMGMRRHGGWGETKTFFMTSEFLATLLGVIAIAITAGVAEDLDSRLATALIAGLIAFYTLSRGIAKSGTRSRATDPRDELDFNRSHDHSHES